ncbi:MAG: DNA-directed RNA polymerase subunit L [Candidatus Woesearchaeota archaeon]
MEFKVIEESKTRLVFQLIGETHTFCNALKNELQHTKGVTIVAYRIDHPLVGVPQFVLETKGEEPRKAIKLALSSLKKKVNEFQKEVAKL